MNKPAFRKAAKPAGFTRDTFTWFLRFLLNRDLLQGGFFSLKTSGLRITWEKAMQKIYLTARYR